MLLIYFQWGNVLSFVISIPVAGVLIFVGALLYAIVGDPWECTNDSRIYVELLIYFVLAGSLLITAYLGVRKVWNVHLTNVALTISYFIWPLWIYVITLFVHGLLTKSEYDPCGNYPYRVEPFSLFVGPNAIIMLFTPYALFWIWLIFIKRIVAKKEA